MKIARADITSFIKATLKLGVIALAASTVALGAYRYLEYRTGFCIETNTFNDKEAIKRAALEKMLPHMYKRSGNQIVKAPNLSIDEFLKLNAECCDLNPYLGEGASFGPNLVELLYGWSYGFEPGIIEITLLEYSGGWGYVANKKYVSSFIISNCGQYMHVNKYRGI